MCQRRANSLTRYSKYGMNSSVHGNKQLLGEAEGEGVAEAGAEGEDLVGEQVLGGGAAAALPPALLPPGRRRLGGGEGRSHRVLAAQDGRRQHHTGGGEERTRSRRSEEKSKCSTSGGWVDLGRTGEK